MKLKFNQKITDREIDSLVNSIYINFTTSPNDKYHFDLSNVEFIGNQELLVLSALLKSFVESNIQFEIEFFKKGIPTTEIPERVKKQIIQFWDVWKIWKILPNAEYDKYFGIDSGSVDRLKKNLKYYPQLPEIYSRYGITPFISLDFINNYNEVEVQKIINPIYKLNTVIEQLLSENDCYHPFTSNSLSTIITEELYLNFLDHSGESSFGGLDNFAFMSISFQTRLDEERYTYEEIQKVKRLNFESECLHESIDFFYDKNKKEYKNIPYMQFSFLDFGQGIAHTLKEQFVSNPLKNTSHSDSDILRYAFNHNSSRHPIQDKKIDRLIPRGLFDTLTIAKRYKGLLIVRSNFGKILFDFSEKDSVDNALSYFGDSKFYFPGTLISLYISAINESYQTNVSSIKPDIEFSKVKSNNIKFNSIAAIADEIVIQKEALYSELLERLRTEICSNVGCSLTYLDFKDSNKIGNRIVKKVLYFLLSDYEINHKNNIIIVDPPKDIIDEIEYEILSLNTAIKNYKIHPLPIINWIKDAERVELRWLGVYDEGDKKRLNNLLLEEYSSAKSDFFDPDNLIGHLIDFDKYGNILSNLPSITKVNELFQQKEVVRLLYKHECIKKDNNEELYLCNGNYYQKEYIELANLISDKTDCDIVAKYLFEKIHTNIGEDILNYFFIGITTPNQKILASLIKQGFIKKDDCILLDSYQTFDHEISNQREIDSSKKYLLVCDAISTGYLAQRLDNTLKSKGAGLDYIMVIVDILDPKFPKTQSFLNKFGGQILSLYQYHIDKFDKNDILEDIRKKRMIRISPHTNFPIKLSINETKYDESVIYRTEVSYDSDKNEIIVRNKFLDKIEDKHIKIGFLRFNNLIHPYFFDTKEILERIDESMLGEIFKQIDINDLKNEHVQIFFPRKSGIENLDFVKLKNKVLTNQSIEEYDIERFGTDEGWRFPHNPEYLSSKIKEDTICLVLDDGSCSGDSIVQMIDEISFYNNKRIILICFIGRIHDHKREFFSRLSMIKNKEAQAEISIFFVSHWHIPTYYLDNNPTTKETEWLQDIINLQNTPQSIRKIAQSIFSQVSPKRECDFTDYKYLPRDRKTSTIPKKELLLIREELGKVIGYRLYKESFDFFDCFFKKYENKKLSENRYKEIELLCAVFIYEPYLYDKTVTILPDIVGQIEEFIRVLIFSDQKIYDLLTYEWEKKDIIHLFFIVFKNEKLIKELTVEKFATLIAFTQPKESALNYVLYKLLIYFPLKESQFDENTFDETLKKRLTEFCGEDVKKIDEIKKYNNFIKTLPSRDNFQSQLGRLQENYLKQKKSENHDKKISFNHNVSLIVSKVRICIGMIEAKLSINNDIISTIQECWFEMLDFINPILSFYRRFTAYTQPYPYFRFTKKIENMLIDVSNNETIIFSLKEFFENTEELKICERSILRIQSDFGDNSEFSNLINNPNCDMTKFVIELYEEISLLPIEDIQKDIPKKIPYSVSIPQLYADKLIKKEISTNIKNHAKTGDGSILKINTVFNGEIVTIEIQNEINKTSNNGNGEGIKCLRMLSDSSLFGFKYSSMIDDKKYIQYLKFKINK